MIDAYFTDKIEITNRTVDEWNRPTDSIQTVSARVERTDGSLRYSFGENKIASYLIFIPYGTPIDIGDRLKITELGGIAFTDDKTWVVGSRFDAAGFEGSHIEVLV